MRKSLSIIALLLTFAWQGAWAQAEITISSQTDFDEFVSNVNDGIESYSGKTVTLNTNVSLTTPIGTEGNPFRGTFDGGGKTLNADISDTQNRGTAPFRYVSGATIQHLTVTGSVIGGQHAASLVGYTADGVNTIYDCRFSVTLSNPATSGDRHMGGIVGHARNATLTLNNCIFDGSMSSTGSIAGGLLGWSDGSTLTISDCLFKGSYTGAGAFHPVAAKRNDKPMTSVSVDRCYYTQLPTLHNQANIAADGTYVLTSQISADDQTVTLDGTTYYINATVNSAIASGFSIDGDLSTDAQGYLFTNMGSEERTMTITDNTMKFNVYDDGGKDGDYSSNNFYVQKLHFVAPEGYVFKVSGNIKSTDTANRLIVRDGIKEIYNLSGYYSLDNFGPKLTTDNQLNIEFDMNTFNDPRAGFVFFVSQEPNTHMHDITLPTSPYYTVNAPATAIYEHTVTLQFDFNGGYALSTVKAFKTGDESTTVPVTLVNDNTCTFTMPDYGKPARTPLSDSTAQSKTSTSMTTEDAWAIMPRARTPRSPSMLPMASR